MRRRRLILLFLVCCGLASGTWLRGTAPPRDTTQELTITPLAQGEQIGAFKLHGAWQLTSPHTDFGGYSALVPLAPGRLLAISDSGNTLLFTPPEHVGPPALIDRVIGRNGSEKKYRDVEAATRDPATGMVWFALEGRNAILRFSPRFYALGDVQPVAMFRWSENIGPEALVRLADGRFVAISEGIADGFLGHRYPAVVFSGDPVDETAEAAGLPFTVAGVPGYRPTDAVQLPDGRVLVLLRRLLWPFPVRFASKLAIGDPREIAPNRVWRLHEVADFHYPLPVDNFEGMALEPQGDGSMVLWLISDGNESVFQRTVMWELRFNPAALQP